MWITHFSPVCLILFSKLPIIIHSLTLPPSRISVLHLFLQKHTHRPTLPASRQVHSCRSPRVVAEPDDGLWEHIVTEYDTRRDVTGALHAELNIFTTLIEEVLRNQEQPPYWAIGGSNLMCIGCYTIIAKAFPRALKQQNHKTMLVSFPPFATMSS
ncbi:hypothetical protein C8R44DRAFT_775352, partial [Mycena epipterygia]